MDPSTRRLLDEDAKDRPKIKPLSRLIRDTHSLSSNDEIVESNVDEDDDDDGGCQLESLREELKLKGVARRLSVTAPPSPTAPRPPPRTPYRRPHLPHLPHLIPWKEFRGRWGSESIHNKTEDPRIRRSKT